MHLKDTIAETMAQQFSGEFTRHPAAHIEYISSGAEGKKVVTKRCPLSEKRILKHLNSSDANGQRGVGARGVSFTVPVECSTGDRKSEWYTDRIVFDFDDLVLDRLSDLADTLEGNGIYIYLTNGTTGRGAHVHLPLEISIPQPEAYKLAEGCAAFFAEQELPRPELFPSCPFGQSKAILLPYRGAALSKHLGYGYNPLLEPAGLKPIHISSLAQLNRTSPDDLQEFVKAVSKPAPSVRSKGSRRVSTRSSHTDPDAAWHAELERVAPEWQEGKRQYLTLALSCYGLYDLGLPLEQVQKGVRKLAQQKGDAEIKVREKAITRTWEKMQRGELVSRNNWYEKAGVEPPSKPAPSQDVLDFLDRLENYLFEQPSRWKGSAALTDRNVLQALISVARQHGVIYANGVEVSISQRELAERAGVTVSTVNKSLSRLRKRITVKTRTAKRKSDAGSVILMSPPYIDRFDISSKKRFNSLALSSYSSENPHKGGRKSVLSKGVLPSSVYPILFSNTGLGTLAGLILDVLIHLGGRAPHAQLTETTGRKGKQLDKPLERLANYGLVLREGRNYVLPKNLPTALKRAAEGTGVLEVRAKRQDLHEKQRAEYNEYLARKEEAGSDEPEEGLADAA